jgi:hypothetical protein
MKRQGIPRAPERKKTTTWTEFIRSHMDVLAATDFFTAEVWTQGGLVTYYVLFFIHLATRRVHIAGITPNPNEPWMIPVARNVTMADIGFLSSSRYLIHDRDSKFCESFRGTIESVGVTPVKLPARSPDLNAFAERWVKSVKEECLSKLIVFGERSLRHMLKEYVAHFHHERNHQGKENLLLFPRELGDGVDVGIPSQRGCEGLDDADHAGPCVRHVDCGGHHLADGFVGESCHVAEKLAVVQEIGPKHFWNGKNPLGVGDVGENLILKHLREDGGALGAARGA